MSQKSAVTNVFEAHGLAAPADRAPDFARFRRAMTTRTPGPVPVGDLFGDPETMEAFLGEPVPNLRRLAQGEEGGIDALTDEVMTQAVQFLEQSVRFFVGAGWDFTASYSLMGFSGVPMHTPDEGTREIAGGQRAFQDSTHGPIMSWEDFEAYPWPESPGSINLGTQMLADMMPDGLEMMVLPGGLFEWTTWLMGLVPFSLALYRQPDLIDAITAKVSNILYAAMEEAVTLPKVGGLFLGDDMGYCSGTVVAPAVLKERFFPHLQRMVDLAHGAGKLAVLHSCGNLTAIMDDLCDLGIDGKHSFEDKIMPVEEVYRRWGDRIGLVGGVDMHLLTIGSEAEIRGRVREILDVCGPEGHYVLGTGNSVASYIPLRNYLVMLDEGRRWNRDHFGSEA